MRRNYAETDLPLAKQIFFKVSVWLLEWVQCTTLANCEDWKLHQSLNSGGQAAAVLTDFSKAFDCIDRELLIAKLHAYGFNNSSLSFIYSYLSERKQRTKINPYFSCWAEIILGVPQGSILGPLLFNAYNCNLLIQNTLVLLEVWL